MDNLPIQVQSGPLSPEQSAALNQVLASLTPVQAAWLAGFMSGQLSGGGAAVGAGVPAVAGVAAGAIPAAAAVSAGEKLTILVGSQTGNAEEIAESALKQATAKGLNAKIVSMSDFKPKKLKDEKNLMLIVSTHGEGDPPDNAEELHEFVKTKGPKLGGMRFSVLGLGDTSYEFFCQTGKDFDAEFEKLGAKRVADRVDCDVDFEDAAEKWIADSLVAFDSVMEKAGVAVAAAPVGVNGAAAPVVESVYNKKNPFVAEVTENLNLNGRGSAKETRHVEISLEGSGLTYEPGDALGIYPVNGPAMVEAMLAATGLAANTTVDAAGGKSLADALANDYDITTLSRPLVEKYNALDPKGRMKALLDEKKKAVLREYIDGREIIDMLEDFPIEGITAEQLCGMFRKMPPRLYSIASSLASVPDEVHLTVGVTRYETNGREREGVCSTFLAERLGEDPKVRVFVDRNKNFKLPADPNTPIIMIGPGTGVAPFRAFMQEREEMEAEGKSWMFFGDQHFTTDFLYQTEWQGWLKSGVLSRMDVAFSRDQEKKVYVQHRMREHAADLYDWIERDGACIYVCGDADKMAEDVHHALADIFTEQGGLSAEDAKARLKTLQKDKRYQRDVY